jgi:pimeloyl-ACP methyl ester carboxylesterase
MLADRSTVRGMPHADVNEQRIFYQDSGGDGPPVILAHGFLMDQTMFDPQVEALAPAHRVITWDERGFGQTEYDGEPFTYWDSAQDLLGLMDHLGIDRAVIGGMSQGGFVSLRAALLAPDRVRALILLDTGAGVQTPERAAEEQGMADMWLTHGPVDDLANAVADLIIAHPEENQKWVAKWQARPKEGMREPLACLFGRDDVSDRLTEITCPAIVIHGLDDTALPMEGAEALADGLSGSGPVVKVPGAHAANLTHPEPVNEALRGFLVDLPA